MNKFVAQKMATSQKQQAALDRKLAAQNEKILKKIVINISKMNRVGADLTLKTTSYGNITFYSFSNCYTKNKNIPHLYFSCFDDNYQQLTETLSDSMYCLKTLKGQIKLQKRLNALKNL